MRRAAYLNPAELQDNPRNLRTSLDDLEDLKASIQVLGILCPLVVIPVDPDDADTPYMIIIGHRRKYAALELEHTEVPCWIAQDEGEALKVAAQLAENGHRVGLSATEEAEGFHQLMLMDWSVEKISAVRHLPVAEVKKTLKLRELPEQARQATDAGQISLDDAARMAEFADEPAALARILKASNTWGVQHAISNERAKKAYTEAKERLKAQLVLDGVKVTSKPKGFPAGPEKPVKVLVDAAGVAADPEVVKALPGFAAFVDKEGIAGAQAVIYCSDPEKYGYTVANPTHYGGRVSIEEQAQRAAAAEAKARRLEGLALAEPVRHEFYKSTFGSAKAAKRLFVEALRSTVIDEDLALYSEWEDLYAALGGVDDDTVLAEAGEDRLRRCLVAGWITRHEQNLRLATHDSTWRMNDAAAASWLDRLIAEGYTLSDAEAELHQDMHGHDMADDQTLAGNPAPLSGAPFAVTDSIHGDGDADGQQDTEASPSDQDETGDLDSGAGGLSDVDEALRELAVQESVTV
ncbi:ParB/RepB/Spo0J family partition protein [Catelliglobosispora koreensis]|uniref:ParB/RepB/Spo0J family partition protein n=1 Tax=Catelliglobosispora koreensis TaxID=129052 RepID=UPI00146C6DB9|nr:ParB/RepB/Spo0J family partition protein [Catelliglobosispora koreensis]